MVRRLHPGRDEALRLYQERDVTLDEIAVRTGMSLATLNKYVRLAGLPPRRKGRPKMNARHRPIAVESKSASLPPVDHPALAEARTLHPKTVVSPLDSQRCLISGFNNRKIGGEILKGPWKGMPIYTLALEERATCPTSCRHWRSCYTNGLHLLKRFRHGADLESSIEIEVAMLLRQNPKGVAVRLHISGDFYSVEYVRLWERLMDRHDKLHVFGFTARIDRDDPIAEALVRLTLRLWPRFAMRFSNAPVDECSTISIEHPIQRPSDAIICPQQQAKTDTCGTCGLCWATKRRIAFLQH